ncbi:hypothetical protein [Thiorhodococcus minor]|uniref:Uncharacterized protein n=1 Tax=Thiorhodococcus minor TaxID=57489 RepID=A0A6M0K7N9_9GAMM|nr:hypothetical protein [Thiorhodococcus minor]NEV64677.1 hypothetical protein [Thiorhodococcus minor]
MMSGSKQWHMGFWDAASERIVRHRVEASTHDEVTMTGCLLSQRWGSSRAARRALPSPVWVAWEVADCQAERLRVFLLDGPPALEEAALDRMREAAAMLRVQA